MQKYEFKSIGSLGSPFWLNPEDPEDRGASMAVSSLITAGLQTAESIAEAVWP
jgi:hypothetical protein